MVKTFVPQEIIDAYNKGKGIDAKEYSYIVQAKKLPPLDSLTGSAPPAPEMEPPDFSDVAPPFDPTSMAPPPGAPPLPAMLPPTPPVPPAAPPTSVPPSPVVGSMNTPPIPAALGGM